MMGGTGRESQILSTGSDGEDVILLLQGEWKSRVLTTGSFAVRKGRFFLSAEEEVKSFAHRTLEAKGTTLLMLDSRESQRPTHRLCWREVPPRNCWWSRSQSPPYRLCWGGVLLHYWRGGEDVRVQPTGSIGEANLVTAGLRGRVYV